MAGEGLTTSRKFLRYLLHGCTRLVGAGGQVKHLAVDEGDIRSGELCSDWQAQVLVEAGGVILKEDAQHSHSRTLVLFRHAQTKSTLSEISHKLSLTVSMFSLWRAAELCKVSLWRQLVWRKHGSAYQTTQVITGGPGSQGRK